MRYDKKNRIVYYKDEFNDDFGEIGLERPKLKEDYVFERKGAVKRFFATIFYYGLALPILWLVGKCAVSVKVKNRKVLKELKHKGYIIYGNHTHWVDAWTAQVFVARPKRTNILGYSDALSIPVAKGLVKGIGLLPVENNRESLTKLTNAITHYINKKECISIFPEAHVWPYYNGIRQFKVGSFFYPTVSKCPIVAMCTIWRKVWYSKKPKMTIYVSQPKYYDETLDQKANIEAYHDYVYEFFVKTHLEHQSVEYIKFIKEEDKA